MRQSRGHIEFGILIAWRYDVNCTSSSLAFDLEPLSSFGEPSNCSYNRVVRATVPQFGIHWSNMRIATSSPKWAHAGISLVVAWLVLIPLAQGIVDAIGGTLIRLPAGTSLSFPLVFLLAAIRGASIGFGQWLVLWVWHFRAASWITATTVGWAIGAVVAMALEPLLRFTPILFAPLLHLAVFWLCPGTFASVGQYFLLRRSVHHTALWIAANAVAWLCGSAFVYAMNFGLFADLGISLAWAVVGLALIWLLRHPQSETVAEATSIAPDIA